MARALLCMMLIAIGACSTAPVQPLSNQNNIRLAGLRVSDIGFSTGVVDGSVYTEAYSKVEKWHYDRAQQQKFIDALRVELDKAEADLGCVSGGCKRIHVDFKETYYESNSGEYILNVRMGVISEKSEKGFSYLIDSSEKSNFWTDTQAHTRQIASQMLLNQILADLQQIAE